MRVHQLKALVLSCPEAKKALAFPKNSLFFSSSRTRRLGAVFSASKLAWIRTTLLGGLAPVALECDPPAHHRFAQPSITSHRRDHRARIQHQTRQITTILRHQTTTSSHNGHLAPRRRSHPLNEVSTTQA